MKIKTNCSIMDEQAKVTKIIAKFWDQMSEGWRTVWGPHIHHGYYENNDPITPLQAQEKLIDKLVEMVSISPQDRILDVGCGIGGSSLILAKKHHANVIGITLSPNQVKIATKQSQLENVSNVSFKVEDALSLFSFANNSFDMVWSLESCEQFYDKKLFIRQAYRVLKPGGKLMLATWCSSNDEYEGKLAKKYKKLCFAFDLPYMPTIDYYKNLLNAQGFTINSTSDWSEQVKKSWDVGISLVNAYSLFRILKMSGWRGLRFATQIKLMQEGLAENRVRYGVFNVCKG